MASAKRPFLVLLLPLLSSSCGGGGSELASSAKAITAFSLAGVAGTIDEPSRAIAVSLPLVTDVTALAATFATTGESVRVGATVQVSGVTANDFTEPVAYTVVAADGSSATYTVTVHLGQRTATGGLVTARRSAAAVRLLDGDVLVAGGFDGYVATRAVERYDPASGAWWATGLLAAGRLAHTLTLLPDGRVLLVGGDPEIYDPHTGLWSATSAMTVTRSWHTATLLETGKVLVAGGDTAYQSAPAELFDPADGSWTQTGAMAATRTGHTATLLPGGEVLVVGGGSGNTQRTAELYDPDTGTFAPTGNLALGRAYGHHAALLSTGEVLVAGGVFNGSPVPYAELYDPVTGTWTATGTLSTSHDDRDALVSLPGGKVLLVGAPSELYDPAAGTWAALDAPRMSSTGPRATATLLEDGRVLVAGGEGQLLPVGDAALLR